MADSLLKRFLLPVDERTLAWGWGGEWWGDARQG